MHHIIICPAHSLGCASSPSPSISPLTVQVDQSGTSLTVSHFSTGGITWSSVSIPSPSQQPAPPPPASSRRMLMQAVLRPPAASPPGLAWVQAAARLALNYMNPPDGPGAHANSTLRHGGQMIGLRSLQASPGATSCAPAITRCATRVLPPLGAVADEYDERAFA